MERHCGLVFSKVCVQSIQEGREERMGERNERGRRVGWKEGREGERKERLSYDEIIFLSLNCISPKGLFPLPCKIHPLLPLPSAYNPS